MEGLGAIAWDDEALIIKMETGSSPKTEVFGIKSCLAFVDNCSIYISTYY
jgi:hypothetical protein